MADPGPLQPASGFPGRAVGERVGAPGADPGVTARLRDDLQLANVVARREAGQALREQLGVQLPDGPRRVGDDTLAWLGVGPDRWLAIKAGGDRSWPAALAMQLDGLAAVVDQSDAYAMVELGGPRCGQTLAKGLPVDLHASAFAADAVAVTLAAHVGTIIWRGGDGFLIAVFRSNAESFWSWLAGAAGEYGLELVG